MLTQGLNRQIRRMCEYLGYKVVSLTRVRIMNVELGNLPVGKWRYLTQPEIEQMETMVASSSKIDTGGKTPKQAVTRDGRERQYIPKKKLSRPADSSPDESVSAKSAKPAIAREGSYKQFIAKKKSKQPVTGSPKAKPGAKPAAAKHADTAKGGKGRAGASSKKSAPAKGSINPKSRKKN